MAMQNNGRDGYSLVQLQMLMQSIAGHMSALNGLLMVAQTLEDEWGRSQLVNAAQSLAQSVGGLADEAADCQILGNACRWHCGMDFAAAGGSA